MKMTILEDYGFEYFKEELEKNSVKFFEELSDNSIIYKGLAEVYKIEGLRVYFKGDYSSFSIEFNDVNDVNNLKVGDKINIKASKQWQV